MTTLYAVHKDYRDAAPRLYSIEVEKETAAYYWLRRDTPAAFRYARRCYRGDYPESPREAWERFLNRAEESAEVAARRLDDAREEILIAKAELEKPA